MTLKIIHVGLGGWGQDWEKNAFPPVAQVESVAFVDAHEPTLAAARARLSLPEAKCFASLEEAMSAVEADAVLVTAPQFAHVPLAIEALEAGKHVLVEKPFSITVAEAREGVAVAERTGKVLMVSQQYRHYPAARKAAQIVADREYGKVGFITVDFRKWGNTEPKEKNKHYGIPHPLIFDMSIHHFDLMRMILQRDAVSVFAQRTDPAWSKFEQEGAAALTITFDGGIVVSYRGSWVSSGRPTHWAGEWHLECERGDIFFTGREGAEAGASGDRVVVTPLGEAEQPLRLVQPRFWGRSAGLVAFAQAIEAGKEPETSGRRNLGSVALMEAAAKSSLSGQVEAVEQTA